jgi:hypothetical protein
MLWMVSGTGAGSGESEQSPLHHLNLHAAATGVLSGVMLSVQRSVAASGAARREMGITERFRVRAEDGTTYNVMKLEGRVGATSIEKGQRLTIGGMPEYVLEDGGHLNQIDEDTFQIRSSRERLTRIK